MGGQFDFTGTNQYRVCRVKEGAMLPHPSLGLPELNRSTPLRRASQSATITLVVNTLNTFLLLVVVSFVYNFAQLTMVATRVSDTRSNVLTLGLRISPKVTLQQTTTIRDVQLPFQETIPPQDSLMRMVPFTDKTLRHPTQRVCHRHWSPIH